MTHLNKSPKLKLDAKKSLNGFLKIDDKYYTTLDTMVSG